MGGKLERRESTLGPGGGGGGGGREEALVEEGNE